MKDKRLDYEEDDETHDRDDGQLGRARGREVRYAQIRAWRAGAL